MNQTNLDRVREMRNQLRNFDAGMTNMQVSIFQSIESALTALEYSLSDEVNN